MNEWYKLQELKKQPKTVFQSMILQTYFLRYAIRIPMSLVPVILSGVDVEWTVFVLEVGVRVHRIVGRVVSARFKSGWMSWRGGGASFKNCRAKKKQTKTIWFQGIHKLLSVNWTFFFLLPC